MLSLLFYAGLFLLSVSALTPLLVFLKREGKPLRKASLMLAFAGTLILLVMSAVIIYTGETISITVYNISIAQVLSFTFTIDRLSAFFILLITLVSAGVALYSMDYVEHNPHKNRNSLLVAFMNVFILSMILVVSSANTFSFLFFWEIMSLASFFLVMFEYEKKESQSAGLFYFIMTQLSTVFLFVAFFLLYASGGSFDIKHIQNISPELSEVIFLCLFAGFGIKAGVIPFHKWLPYAHAAAPSNISALMSGVMIKVAIYGLIRFVVFVLDPTVWWGILILIAGTVSAILGVMYAMKEHDIKRLLAFHSIENIGIILIGFGAYVIFSLNGFPVLAEISLLGALFHTLNHAVFKSLLFLTAGSVVNAVGTKNIELMGGLIRRMPKTAMLFFIGAASISALPPLNGFVSELLIFQSLMQSYSLTDPVLKVLMIMCLSIFALTSALAAACFVKAFGTIFLAVPRSQNALKANEAGFPMIIGPGILAASCIILGVFSCAFFPLAGYAIPVPDMSVIGIILLFIAAVIFATVKITSPNKTRIGETWGCGIISQNNRMEYTASGFSEPVEIFFRSIYHTQETNKRIFFDNENSTFKEGYAEINLLNFFEKYVYMPIAGFVGCISMFMYRLQNGDLSTYLFYAFVSILVLLITVRWFI